MSNSKLTLHGAGEDSHQLKSINKDKTYFYRSLAKKMEEDSKIGLLRSNNRCIPSGYTYLGQLIAHDLSINNHLTGRYPPNLHLNCVYGFGPNISYNLYEQNLKGHKAKFNSVFFKIWNKKKDLHDVYRLGGESDLYPIIADFRNDENFVISQLHVEFMKFHNKLAVQLAASNSILSSEELFIKTRLLVIQYYQNIVLHDYLKRIVCPQLVSKLIKDDKNFLLYPVRKNPSLKEEFIKAAFRLGHSQVRNNYKIIVNNKLGRVPLFSRTKPSLMGFHRDLNRKINWEEFFPLGSRPNKVAFSRSIDTVLAKSLFKLPYFAGDEKNLAMRNFLSGNNIEIKKLLHPKIPVLKVKDYGNKPNASSLITFLKKRQIDPIELPAWLYFLLEGELKGRKVKLGPLGSQIVAEQIIWILKHDPFSVLNDKSNKVAPFFNMINLLNF